MRVHIIRVAFACGATMFQARAWYVNMQGILTLARALMKVMMPGDVSHWGEIELRLTDTWTVLMCTGSKRL